MSDPKKKKYGVSIVWTVSKYREIEATSAEEAEGIADETIEEPSLCWECAEACEGDLNHFETKVEEIKP